MTSFNDRYPQSGFFKADHLKGQPDLVVQIDHVDLDVIIAGSSKDVVRFTNDARSLVLNRSTGEMIARLYGDEIDDWNGKWIVLYCDETVKFGDEIKPGIRVRNLKPDPNAPGMGGTVAPLRHQPRPDLDDEIPF